MTEYSEATKRVFERSLENLKGKLDDSAVEALRALLAAGNFGDLDAVEEILRPNGLADGDR